MDDSMCPGEEFACQVWDMKRIKDMDEEFYDTVIKEETSIYAVLNKDMGNIEAAKTLMLNSKPEEAKRLLKRIIKNRSRRKST